MADALFDIVFGGQILAGAEAAQVKAGLARLFKADAARIDALFATRTVIKKGVDEATARNYVAALAKVGARVEIVPATAPAAQPSPAPAAAVPMTVAEPGVLLVEPVVVPTPAFDLSGMTLAEVGALLADPDVPPVPAFDLSGLQLAPPGTVLDERLPPPPAEIDTSGLSLSQP